MFRFLRMMFLIFMGGKLLERLRKMPMMALDSAAGVLSMPVPYGPHSERLWENATPCSKYRIRYRSETVNQYQEPVFYRREGEYTVSPERPRLPGCFDAHPGGLHLDPSSGTIDVNKSDTGIRYRVSYQPCGQSCTAQTNVVIGGVGYEGGVFSLSQSEDELKSRPFFYNSDCNDEVPSRKELRGEFGFWPSTTKPTADLMGLSIDPLTGVIHLKDTIARGSLGFRPDGKLPENGASKEFKVYYRLDTPEMKGMDYHTSLRIHFFDSVDQIPEDLLVRIRQQQGSVRMKSLGLPLVLASSFSFLGDSPWDLLAGLAAALTSLLLLNAGGSNNPMRPPEHCVVS